MIDYSRIGRSCDYYGTCGYKRVESPWVVSEFVSDLTKPDESSEWRVNKSGVLVASGEQSFLSMYLDGSLPRGSFQTITPCFRGDRIDDTHRKYFIKNELIRTDIVSETTLKEMINHSREFFKQELGSNVSVSKTDEGFDIMYKKIELGSYGIRKCNFLEWVYGTGCAEPRMSFVKNL